MDKTEKILKQLEHMLNQNEIKNDKIEEEISGITKDIKDNVLNLNDLKHKKHANEEINEVISVAVQQIENHD